MQPWYQDEQQRREFTREVSSNVASAAVIAFIGLVWALFAGVAERSWITAVAMTFALCNAVAFVWLILHLRKTFGGFRSAWHMRSQIRRSRKSGLRNMEDYDYLVATGYWTIVLTIIAVTSYFAP